MDTAPRTPQAVAVVTAAAAVLAALLLCPAPAAARAQRAATNPLDGTGMWIWQVPLSSGGNPGRIGAQARTRRVRSVYLKSSDGTYMWRQFTPALVGALKSQGLRVCAWQYVYGTHPESEAALGARAVQYGADCLIIDAEAEYEGRYAQADRYIRTLRQAIGARYPLAVSPFPYVDYHPAFPYSVFLGPNGADYNLPQMYWRAIGTSVDQVFAHTYTYNRLYGRRIYPLGQLYQNPSPAQIRRFRALAGAYGASGVNWWDWQEARTRGWQALAAPLTASAAAPTLPYPVLGSKSRGDLVVWAQQHLASAGYSVRIDGVYGASTVTAVSAFQAAKGIPVTGKIGDVTWPALLRYPATPVAWSQRRTGRAAMARSTAASAPASARLPALGREIPPKRHGAG
jgi:hypothetical protein